VQSGSREENASKQEKLEFGSDLIRIELKPVVRENRPGVCLYRATPRLMLVTLIGISIIIFVLLRVVPGNIVESVRRRGSSIPLDKAISTMLPGTTRSSTKMMIEIRSGSRASRRGVARYKQTLGGSPGRLA